MAEEILNPIGYGGKAEKPLAPRLPSLRGKTIALLDIGFPNTLADFHRPNNPVSC